MGDEVRYMHIIWVFAFLKGDGKSGDAVVARYSGKNCKMRVPRLCLTSLDKLMIHFMHAHGWWESTWISFTLVPLNRPQQENWKGREDITSRPLPILLLMSVTMPSPN
jgi:hypothetical protein